MRALISLAVRPGISTIFDALQVVRVVHSVYQVLCVFRRLLYLLSKKRRNCRIVLLFSAIAVLRFCVAIICLFYVFATVNSLVR